MSSRRTIVNKKSSSTRKKQDTEESEIDVEMSTDSNLNLISSTSVDSNFKEEFTDKNEESELKKSVKEEKSLNFTEEDLVNESRKLVDESEKAKSKYSKANPKLNKDNQMNNYEILKEINKNKLDAYERSINLCRKTSEKQNESLYKDNVNEEDKYSYSTKMCNCCIIFILLIICMIVIANAIKKIMKNDEE